MRTALFLCRSYPTLSTRRLPLQQIYRRCYSLPPRWRVFRQPPQRNRYGGKTLFALLSPAAFVRLSEEDNGDGKTPEEHMLEASRAEIQKGIPETVHGPRRSWQSLLLFLDTYFYEPIATGVRFLHLVVIFVPVILTVPVIWFGNRLGKHDHNRTGTVWWYRFLVHSMERAGPAFIKVIYRLTHDRLQI